MSELTVFTDKAKLTLSDLNFEEKKGIVKELIEKITGSKKELQVYGYIPITSNINVFTINRRCRPSKCW